MTVGELKRALADVPDSLEITVRAENEDGDFFCGGIAVAGVEQGCSDELFFAIDCQPDEDES